MEEGLWSNRDRVEDRAQALDRQEERIVHLEDLVRSLGEQVAKLEANHCRCQSTEQVDRQGEMKELFQESRPSPSRNWDTKSVSTETTVRGGPSRETGEDIPWDRMEHLTVTAVKTVGSSLGRHPMVSSFSCLGFQGTNPF